MNFIWQLDQGTRMENTDMLKDIERKRMKEKESAVVDKKVEVEKEVVETFIYEFDFIDGTAERIVRSKTVIDYSEDFL